MQRCGRKGRKDGEIRRKNEMPAQMANIKETNEKWEDIEMHIVRKTEERGNRDKIATRKDSYGHIYERKADNEGENREKEIAMKECMKIMKIKECRGM